MYPTFLVEPDRQAERCVSCPVGDNDTLLTPLKELDNGECLPRRAVLAGVMESSVPFSVHYIYLQNKRVGSKVNY